MDGSGEHFDVVIIGSGAGGGTMAHALAGTEARVLLVERGEMLPQEPENWDPGAVWKQKRYRPDEMWLDRRGREFLPFVHYMVGGNTKFWGAVLYRLRPDDFDAVEHADGVSPGWSCRAGGTSGATRRCTATSCARSATAVPPR